MDGYGYEGGYAPNQQYVPMMPQPGFPANGMTGGATGPWPAQQVVQAGPVSGPLPDSAVEDGFMVPARLGDGSSVPVTRCPDGGWATSFAMGDREFHTLVYVQVTDGTFAPYHLEGVGALRIAPDAADGQAYLMRVPVPNGKPIHVLHVPPERG